MSIKKSSKTWAGASLAAGALVGRAALRRLRQGNLVDQVVFITGGSRGLGFLLAREFAREGCRVAICARDGAELERARQRLAHDGFEALTLVCDVTDRDQAEWAAQEVTDTFGGIDILVTNAGALTVGPLHAMTDEDFQFSMNVILWGTVYPTLAVMPQMRRRGSGRIVHITSVGGKVSIPHMLPYSTAKFAAVGFSEGLRAELQRDGIQVVTIAPGLMRTGSYLNAIYKGRPEAEYRLGSVFGNLPVVSMDAERAARQVVKATKRGEAGRVLGVPAHVLALMHGLFPGLTADLAGLVNRLLPWALYPTPPYRGLDLEAEVDSTLHRIATAWGQSAGRRFNQYPGPMHTAPAVEGYPADEAVNGHPPRGWEVERG